MNPSLAAVFCLRTRVGIRFRVFRICRSRVSLLTHESVLAMATMMCLTGSTVGDIAVLAAISWIWWSIQSYRKLSHIPGPRLWGWNVLPLLRIHISGHQYDGFKELSKKYGKIVRIAPETILVSDADLLRRMSAPRSPYTRSVSVSRFILL